MIKKKIYMIGAVIIALLAVGCLSYLWWTWGARGMYADATQTGGYTTSLEDAVAVVTIILFSGAIVMFVLAQKKK